MMVGFSRHHAVDPTFLPSGNPLKCHEEVLSWRPMFPPKRFGNFSTCLGDAQKVGYVPIILYTRAKRRSFFFVRGILELIKKNEKLQSLENMRVLLQPLWGAQIATKIRIAQLKSAPEVPRWLLCARLLANEVCSRIYHIYCCGIGIFQGYVL